MAKPPTVVTNPPKATSTAATPATATEPKKRRKSPARSAKERMADLEDKIASIKARESAKQFADDKNNLS